MSADSPSLLLLIIDLHPLSWQISTDASTHGSSHTASATSNGSSGHVQDSVQTASGTTPGFTLDKALNDVVVFLNSHLAMRYGNELVLYAAMEGGRSELIYSSHEQADDPLAASTQAPLPSNSFQPFYSMQEAIRDRLKTCFDDQDGVKNGTAGSEEYRDGPAIVPALLRALCHINRLHPASQPNHAISNLQSSTTGQHVLEEDDGSSSDPSRSLQTRIMIINNTPDRGSGGYVGLMNAVFAAQKRKTPIDVLNVHNSDSIFLQQAAHLTHGLYYKLPKQAALLMYLNLGLPSQDKVDFRAVCFCHQRVVDVGFVCSVCLSIFCSPLPICSTCKSRFPIQSIQQLKKALPPIVSATAVNGAPSPAEVLRHTANQPAKSSPLAQSSTAA